MQRLLKSTALEHSPGGEIISATTNGSENENNHLQNDSNNKGSSNNSNNNNSSLLQPLKTNLAAQKRDDRFRFQFRLPSTEHLLQSVEAVYIVEEEEIIQKDENNNNKSNDNDDNNNENNKEQQQQPSSQIRKIQYQGKLAVSEAYLTFYSTGRGLQYQTVLPLYTIRRVERLNDKTHTYGIKILNWHQATIYFDLLV